MDAKNVGGTSYPTLRSTVCSALFAVHNGLVSHLCSHKRVSDQVHNVRMAIGNGIRPEVWRTFISRFGHVDIKEFYGSTEGTLGFLNYAGKIGAVGRVNSFHKVDLTSQSVHLLTIHQVEIRFHREMRAFLTLSLCCFRKCFHIHWLSLIRNKRNL